MSTVTMAHLSKFIPAEQATSLFSRLTYDVECNLQGKWKDLQIYAKTQLNKKFWKEDQYIQD